MSHEKLGRFIGGYKVYLSRFKMTRPKLTASLVSLVAANLVPLVGVVLFGWDAAMIVLLYWTENLVIGFYHVLRIAVVRVEHRRLHLGKLIAIPFFCVHFGGFCAVHGFLLLALFKLGGGTEPFLSGAAWPGFLVFVQLLVSVIAQLWESRPAGMEWPVLSLFASHGVSFIQNYLLGREYTSLSMENLMIRPYKRIAILHVAIIAGGMPVMVLGSPVPLLCILVLLKICLDIHLHMKSHRVQKEGKKKPRYCVPVEASNSRVF
jgi:hypothetical protein